jgi:hypothetical protein
MKNLRELVRYWRNTVEEGVKRIGAIATQLSTELDPESREGFEAWLERTEDEVAFAREGLTLCRKRYGREAVKPAVQKGPEPVYA